MYGNLVGYILVHCFRSVIKFGFDRVWLYVWLPAQDLDLLVHV